MKKDAVAAEERLKMEAQLQLDKLAKKLEGKRKKQEELTEKIFTGSQDPSTKQEMMKMQCETYLRQFS